MSVVSAALVLVILGAFVHCSSAIRCYECAASSGWCEIPQGPLEPPWYNADTKTCLDTYDACWWGEATARYGMEHEICILEHMTINRNYIIFTDRTHYHIL